MSLDFKNFTYSFLVKIPFQIFKTWGGNICKMGSNIEEYINSLDYHYFSQKERKNEKAFEI